MSDARLIAKGRIDDLSKGFNLPNNTPFSIYLRSISGVVENDTIVQCRLICDKEVGALPVPICDWTPGKIVELPPNAIDTNKFEVYWGASDNPYK